MPSERLDAAHSALGATPILDRLESFSRTRALVFGSYSEASHDVHSLIEAAARAKARRIWRAVGARTESEAYGMVVAGMRRFVGVSTAREFARHRLHRIPLVGVPRRVLDERRSMMAGRRMAIAAERQQPYISAHDFYAYQTHRMLGD